MEVTTSSTIDNENMYDYITVFVQNPTIFIVLFIVILAYVIYFFYLGNKSSDSSSSFSSSSSSSSPSSFSSSSSSSSPSSSSSSSSTKIIIAIVVGVLFILILINLFKYFFGIDIIVSLKDLFSNKPLLDIKVEQTVKTEIPSKPSYIPTSNQVFNIPGNNYKYSDAKTLCKAYNSRLATYDEVENAYNTGAEWCNYGWSEKQLALFPTQKLTYDKLQQVKGHENDCGRSGINGGYIANPNIKFGVNCFGKKPKMTEEEEALMQASTLYPKTNEDIRLENQVDYWKTKLDQILVSPFNHSSWYQ